MAEIRSLEKRLARIERIRSSACLDLSQVPTDELQQAVAIARDLGIEEAGGYAPEPTVLEECHAQVLRTCPSIRAACERAGGHHG